jgi:hypothetical protein
LKEKAMEILTENAHKVLGQQSGDNLLKSFNISTSNDSQDALFAATKFFTVNAFVRPSVEYTRAWPDSSKAHLFAFCQGNPFPGTYQGKATHTVDALYQFQNVADQFPTKEDKELGVDFALALVSFAHGIENVPSFGKDEKVKVWGPNGKLGYVVTLKDDPMELNRELETIKDLGVLKVWEVMVGYLTSP